MNRRSFLKLRPTEEPRQLTSAERLANAMNPQPLQIAAGLEEYTQPLTVRTAEHLLRRTGFQYNRAEVQKIIGKTASEVVDAMLTINPATLPAVPTWAKNAPVNNLQLNYSQNDELRTLWFMQMLSGANPLLEKMTFFWHNLFANEEKKVYYSQYMYWQNDTFRRNPTAVSIPHQPASDTNRTYFGNIRTLTKAMVRDMAMLIYLDGNQSMAGNPNENFAREILELFTLGIGNYTEQDIVEAARAFTGWRIEGLTSNFKSSNFDGTSKTFMGKTGNFGADDIVDIIFQSPACATFFAKRFYKFFVYEVPSDDILTKLAAELTAANFELKPFLKKLLTSAHFFDEQLFGAVIKSPLDAVIGTARLLDVKFKDNLIAVRALGALSLELLNPPDVSGWKGYHQWINTSTLPMRQKFTDGMIDGSSLVNTPVPETKIDPVAFVKSFGVSSAVEVLTVLARYFLPFELSGEQSTALVNDAFGGYDWTVDAPNAKAGIERLLKALMRLPEFQLM
ncbi:MAG: DUF1800 domain-containing protein [Candidatus Kapaibacterium sp.]